ncbi:hypothetical protein JB92DRAFT_809003 [Gautieria morchelliformis]|nr:hypothetical protein JB92DRAFT_809003 [Gautieria morchelliformis]
MVASPTRLMDAVGTLIVECTGPTRALRELVLLFVNWTNDSCKTYPLDAVCLTRSRGMHVRRTTGALVPPDSTFRLHDMLRAFYATAT